MSRHGRKWSLLIVYFWKHIFLKHIFTFHNMRILPFYKLKSLHFQMWKHPLTMYCMLDSSGMGSWMLARLTGPSLYMGNIQNQQISHSYHTAWSCQGTGNGVLIGCFAFSAPLYKTWSLWTETSSLGWRLKLLSVSMTTCKVRVL